MADSEAIEALAERVGRLERENALLKRVGGMLLVGAAVLVAVGTDLVRPRRQVEAERFVVRDGAGHVRAALALKADGQPELTLNDEQGATLARLGVGPDRTTGLEFYKDDRARVALRSGPNGEATLDFFDRSARAAAGMYLWPDRSAGLNFREGARNAQIAVKADGDAKLTLSDADNDSRCDLGFGADGTLALPCLDHDHARPAAGSSPARVSGLDRGPSGYAGPMPPIGGPVRRTTLAP